MSVKSSVEKPGLTLRPWLELTADEKKSAIARRLGIVRCDQWEEVNFGSLGGPGFRKRCNHADGKCVPYGEVGSINGRVGGLPDWPTDDALAFTEVWTKLIVADSNLLLGLSDDRAGIPGIKPSVTSHSALEYMTEPIVGDTWADAICSAAYALLPDPDEFKEPLE